MTASVADVRAFIGRRRRRRWFDWYGIGFAVVLAGILSSDVLAAPFSRLVALPGSSVPAQAEAGAALVAGAAAGLLVLAQAFGPLALSPADAHWLLLSPLDRRGVLRRSATSAAALSLLAGAALGALALAMAGPYLRHGTHRVPWAWLTLAALGGAGLFLALVLTAMLAQPRPRWRARLRAGYLIVGVTAALGAVAGERWTALSRTITDAFAKTSSGTLGGFAAITLLAAIVMALLVWRALPRFPADVMWTESARIGTARLAVAFLNLSLLAWIAEDNHWRGRRLPARPWPVVARRSPAVALAWADWRRLGRRPALLAVLAVSVVAPALAGAATTGHGRGYAVAAVLLAGAITAGLQGTAALRRDTTDQVLRRLLGVGDRAALTARAVLPALLSAAWLTLAFTLLVPVGILHGWRWPLLGLIAGPGTAAAALQLARTGAVDAADTGTETTMGPVPAWLVTRLMIVLLGGVGCFPALRAVLAGRVTAGTIAGQLAVSAIVLGGYLLVVTQRPSA